MLKVAAKLTRIRFISLDEEYSFAKTIDPVRSATK